MSDLDMGDLQAALNPETSPKVLERLFDKYFYTIETDNESAGTYVIGSAITSNPNSPVSVLRMLTTQFLNAVATNPVIPLLLVENPLFFETFSFDEVMTLLEHPIFVKKYGALILNQVLNNFIYNESAIARRYILGYFWSSTMLKDIWHKFINQSTQKVDITDCSFAGINFFGISFKNLSFKDVQFKNCYFTGCSFSDCVISSLEFKLCGFGDSSFSELFQDEISLTSGLSFIQCDLSYGSYYDNNVPSVIFKQCKLDEFNIRNSYVYELSFINCQTYNPDIGFKTALKLHGELDKETIAGIKEKNYNLNIVYLD